jgi:hypothetical protein
MKKLMLLFLLLYPSFLFSQTLGNKAQAYKDVVMKYAYNHLTPMQIKVLEQDYCGPECYTTYVGGEFVPWDKKSSDKIILGEIGTVVHESTHGFTHGNNERYVVSETSFIEIEETDIVKSNLIVDDMIKRNPKVKDMFRFDTYVNTTRNMSSSVYGIYGLMNEYCAYYNGTSTSFILFEVFKEKHSDNEAEEVLFRQIENKLALSMMSSVTAFYEFNSFIGAYLLYVEKNEGQVYKDIINNTALVTAYSTVTTNFNSIAQEIHNYFPEHQIRHERFFGDHGYSISTMGSNENLLVAQEIFQDYIDVLNRFNNSNLILTKK